ncbi:MAG: metallophosphoesterase [Deltaproteobacteria bacterium]
MARSIVRWPARVAAVVSMFAAAGPASAQFRHGPRIGVVRSDSATIAWDTACSAADTLLYGTDALNQKATEATATTAHRITVQGLAPATAYQFQVNSCGGTSPVLAFTTAPTAGGQSFAFVSMADTRGKSDAEDLKGLSQGFKKILANAETQGGVFVMHVGDMFYGYNPDQSVMRTLYDKFKTATDGVAAKIPFLVNPGGHEMSPWKKGGAPATDWSTVELFREEFAQPKVLDEYAGTLFSWDYGDTHFVSIDTAHFDPKATTANHGIGELSTAEIEWLEKDLTDHESARFIFVFGHHHAWRQPDSKLFYLGSYTPLLRDAFWQMLEKHRVTVYVCGHEHRTIDTLGPPGGSTVVQWLNGNSGAPPDDPNEKPVYEYTVWAVTGDTATAKVLDDSGILQKQRIFQRRSATSSAPVPGKEATP